MARLGVRVPQPHRVVARARDEQTAVSAERSREDGLIGQYALFRSMSLIFLTTPFR